MTEPHFRLSVVIPIGALSHSSRSTSTCARERAWQLQDDAHYATLYLPPNAQQSESECTEEEKVALEQLTHLRRIRELSMQEDADDGSCSTEGSFNTYDRKLPSLLAAPSYTRSHKGDPVPTASPATSSSAACPVHHTFIHSKPMQDAKDGCHQSNRQGPTSKHATTLPDRSLESDTDERLKPRSRLLSDLYEDHRTTKSDWTSRQPRQRPSKKRRKAISKIMAAGQPSRFPEAVAAGGCKGKCSTHA